MDKFLKKLFSAILLFFICFSLANGLFVAKKAAAGTDPDADVPSIIKLTSLNAQGFAAVAVTIPATEKELSLEKLAVSKFRKMLLDWMVNDIIGWIQNDENPRFVTDWKSFLKNVADEAGGQVLEEMIGTDLMAGLCQPDWAVKLNISLATPQTFENEAMCTLSDIGANFDDFMDNFHDGGWEAWLATSESQNNPYGLYLMTLNEKLERESKALTAAKERAQAGFGLLSDRVCRERSCIGENDNEIGNWTESEMENCYCEHWETRTPGKIVGDMLSTSVSKDLQWLWNNEDWESYVIAITDALVNRLITEGVLAITSSDTGGGAKPDPYTPDADDVYDDLDNITDELIPEDTTPPISSVSLSRDWDEDEFTFEDTNYWEITLSANESGWVFYTTDKTEPFIASPYYTEPVKIAETATLKWYGMDDSGNDEDIQTLEITVSDENNNINAAITNISLERNPDTNYWTTTITANKPCDIFYTTDGTEPTIFSTPYIEPIEITASATLKWFSVTTVDWINYQEAIQTIFITVNE